MTQTIYGRILTPDGLRFICASFDYDPEQIGKHKISTSSTTNDLRKAFNLGLIKRHAASDKGGNHYIYIINMTMPGEIRTEELTDLQRSCLTKLYDRFSKKAFTVEKAARVLDTKGSSASFHLTNLTERGILNAHGSPGSPLEYTVAVTPREHPECFMNKETEQVIGIRPRMIQPAGGQRASAI